MSQFLRRMTCLFTLLVALVLNQAEAKEQDLRSLYSPHSITLAIQVHWRGTFGGGRVYTHYTIVARADNQEIAEFDHDYRFSEFSNIGLEEAQEDLKRYEKILSEAKMYQKLVLVHNASDPFLKNGIELVDNSDEYLTNKEDRRLLRCYNALIFRGSLLGPEYVKSIEELLKKVKEDFSI